MDQVKWRSRQQTLKCVVFKGFFIYKNGATTVVNEEVCVCVGTVWQEVKQLLLKWLFITSSFFMFAFLVPISGIFFVCTAQVEVTYS